MPYMKDDLISQAPIDGGIAISDAQYDTLLTAKLEGKNITVRDGSPFVYSMEKRTIYKLVDNIVEEQDILTEDLTPDGWSNQKPIPVIVPTYKTQFSSLDYLDKFTPQEYLAIVTASMTIPQIKIVYDQLMAADYIDVNDARTGAGIDALISAELLEQSRKETLLQPELIS